MILRDLQDLAGKGKRKAERVKPAVILKDLQDLVNKENRKTAQRFAVGVGIAAAAGLAAGILFALKSGKETREDLKNKAVNTVETIKDTVQKKAETVNAAKAHAVQEAHNVIDDVHGKAEGVTKDIKDGSHEITQDIHKTAENISNEFDKSVK